MIDCIIDGLIDTLKILPYLILTFIVLEYIEHKLNKKSQNILEKNKRFGPLIGGLLGGLPQCGFSTMAAHLFSNRVITMGTAIAIFLSTSDEMLAIMISEKADILLILKIILFKMLVGIVIGYIIDLFYRKKNKSISEHIHHMCDDENCDCEHDGIIKSGIKHALKIGLFILIVNLIINIVIYGVGEEKIANLLVSNNFLTRV